MAPPTGNEEADTKLIVTGTAVPPTRRFCSLMLKSTFASCPRIGPDDTAAVETVSVDDSKVTPTAPGVTPPSVRPPIVTVKAIVGIVAPVVVITKCVAVVGPHVAVTATTLLDTKVGVTDAAKKSGG